MSKENNKELQKVIPIGNDGWIVAKSKRYPGHLYYFNTSTGETAWNLKEYHQVFFFPVFVY